MNHDRTREALEELEAIIESEAALREEVSARLRLAEIGIDLVAIELTRARRGDDEISRQMSRLELAGIDRRLAELARDILAWYGLPFEPDGSNEPPVGSEWQRRLRRRAAESPAADEVELVRLRDRLAAWLARREVA